MIQYITDAVAITPVNYLKCGGKCFHLRRVVMINNISLLFLFSVQLAVSRAAAIKSGMDCPSVFGLDTEPSPHQGSVGTKVHHILTNWVHYLGGMWQLPAKGGWRFGPCFKVPPPDELAGKGLGLNFWGVFSKGKGSSTKVMKVALEFWICTLANVKVACPLLRIVRELSLNPLLQTHHWYVNAGQLVWQCQHCHAKWDKIRLLHLADNIYSSVQHASELQ